MPTEIAEEIYVIYKRPIFQIDIFSENKKYFEVFFKYDIDIVNSEIAVLRRKKYCKYNKFSKK